MAAFFLLSWLVSPGYMKQNKNQDDAVECLAKYPTEPHKVCPDCLVARDYLRSSSQSDQSTAMRAASA